MKSAPSITIEEMAKYASVERRTIERNIKTLKEKGIIGRVGADKNGHWIVYIWSASKMVFIHMKIRSCQAYKINKTILVKSEKNTCNSNKSDLY